MLSTCTFIQFMLKWTPVNRETDNGRERGGRDFIMLLIDFGFRCLDGLPVQNKQKLQKDNGSKQTTAAASIAKRTRPNLLEKGKACKGRQLTVFALPQLTTIDSSIVPLSGPTETTRELFTFVFYCVRF